MSTISTDTILPAAGSRFPSSIFVRRIGLRDCASVCELIHRESLQVLGVSVRLRPKTGEVDAFALATSKHIFLVAVGQAVPNAHRHGHADLARVLDHPTCILAGFAMARIALHLHRQFGSRVRGVDMSTLLAPSTSEPWSPSHFLKKKIDFDARSHRVNALWYGDGDNDLCLRAWTSAICAEDSLLQIEHALKIDTSNLTNEQLACISQLIVNVELLEAAKPTQQDNEFDDVDVGSDGELVIQNARYKTRVRRSQQTSVFLETSHGEQILGRAVSSHGKQTGVRILDGNFRGGVSKIQVVGREEATNAERARDEFLLHLLRGAKSLEASPFIQRLWFPSLGSRRRSDPYTLPSSETPASFSKLNDSQREVATAMINEDEPIVIAHGPPGTGKTTTIGAALEYWDSASEPAWVIAQSNVGVKNIARSLVSRDIKFKLLVSLEFHFEWHEHIYGDVQDLLIVSDDLFDPVADVPRMLGDAVVILCTLSMLSNPAMDLCGIFRQVPVERLVVDEASQIDTFEFMHLFDKFRKLEKVCLFGDPKQLPPYGQDVAPGMKTIFDLKQFKASNYFLNTQYRMPVPLGQFISEHVYNSKLRSQHAITDTSCITFVDVRKGQEEFVGSSWRNMEEVHAVVSVVKNYYRHKEFCIITPYDAQRAAIARQLKAENLPSEFVYNVDSFQGHEAEYVIVSPVRTASVGFLYSASRMNVMLTRCTRGMVVVTQRAFLRDVGGQTLLGKLARCWQDRTGDAAWVDSLALSDMRASLPGAPGRRPALAAPVAHSPSRSLDTSRSGPSSPTSVAPKGRAPHRPAANIAMRPHLRALQPVLARTPHLPPAHPKIGSISIDMDARKQVQGDDFPSLGGTGNRTKPRGQWAKGSDACKLRAGR